MFMDSLSKIKQFLNEPHSCSPIVGDVMRCVLAQYRDDIHKLFHKVVDTDFICGYDEREYIAIFLMSNGDTRLVDISNSFKDLTRTSSTVYVDFTYEDVFTGRVQDPRFLVIRPELVKPINIFNS